MKRLIFALGLAFGIASSQAATLTVGVAASGLTNLPTFLGVGCKVSQVVLTASSTNNFTPQFIDASGTNLTYVIPAYTNIVSYVTNVISTYTNYYGVTTSLTNLGLVDVSTGVSAVTNSWPTVLSGFSQTNLTTTYAGTWNFLRGILVTNTTAASGTITITYSQ